MDFSHDLSRSKISLSIRNNSMISESLSLESEKLYVINNTTLKIFKNSILNNKPFFNMYSLECGIKINSPFFSVMDKNPIVSVAVTISDITFNIFFVINSYKILDNNMEVNISRIKISGISLIGWRLINENNMQYEDNINQIEGGVSTYFNIYSKNFTEFLSKYYGINKSIFKHVDKVKSLTKDDALYIDNLSNYEFIEKYLKIKNPILGKPLICIDDFKYNPVFVSTDIYTAIKNPVEKKIQASLSNYTKKHNLNYFDFRKKIDGINIRKNHKTTISNFNKFTNTYKIIDNKLKVVEIKTPYINLYENNMSDIDIENISTIYNEFLKYDLFTFVFEIDDYLFDADILDIISFNLEGILYKGIVTNIDIVFSNFRINEQIELKSLDDLEKKYNNFKIKAKFEVLILNKNS